MKTWQVPLAGVLLVVVSAVVGSLSFPSQTAARDRRSGDPTRGGGIVAATDVEPELASSRKTDVRSDGDPVTVAAPSTRAKEPAAGSPLAAILANELGLSEVQVREMEKVLVERALEIEEVHRGIRAAGIFNAREYSRWIREIQGRSYDRIEAVLDSRQIARFREMLARREINDAVAFTLDPGMAILE